MRLVFVGGHHTSAMAVIESLLEKRKVALADIFWIGHKFSMWGDKNPGAEYREVTALGIPFYDLKAGKLYRTFHPLKLLRLPLGFLQAFYYLQKIKPDLVVSFGGYLAVPVVTVGWLLGIPAVTCEQTVVSGWANRVVAHFAKRIFVAWPQSARFLPERKVVVTGLPLRREIIKNPRLPAGSKLQQFLTAARQSQKPLLYITGGKQGSHVVNEVVCGALKELLRDFNIVHQCGSSSLHDDLKNLTAQSSRLTAQLRSRYFVQDYFEAKEIGAIYHACDLVVGRAGAHTVYELAAVGKPALFIPIPWVSHNEQERNAQLLVDLGAAEILPQEELTPERLSKQLKAMVGRLDDYKKAAGKAKNLVIENAAEKIAVGILGTVEK